MISRHLLAICMVVGLIATDMAACLAADSERRVVPDTAPRLALVIGNANYKSLTKLKNPANDARAVAARLRQIGFNVTEAADLDLPTLSRQVETFAGEIEKRGRDTVALVYYAGHGLEDNSINYLVPVGAELKKRADIRVQSVSVQKIAERLAAAHNQLNILIIDACRNNPYADAQASPTTGLVPMGAIYGVFIASSTGSGKAALDGEDDHSPYTSALTEAMLMPGEKLEDIFKRVRRKVRLATGEQQIPWESTSLELDFYFLQPTPAPSPVQQLFSAAKETGNPALYELLMDRFPGTPEAQEAEHLAATATRQTIPAIAFPASPPAANVLARARTIKSTEAFDLVVALFPQTSEAEEARAEAARLREVTALDSAGQTLEGKDLIRNIQQQLVRLGCVDGSPEGTFDSPTIQGLRHATLLTDDRFLWYRPTMAALRALRRVEAQSSCKASKLAAVPRCLRMNNEEFCR